MREDRRPGPDSVSRTRKRGWHANLGDGGHRGGEHPDPTGCAPGCWGHPPCRSGRGKRPHVFWRTARRHLGFESLDGEPHGHQTRALRRAGAGVCSHGPRHGPTPSHGRRHGHGTRTTQISGKTTSIKPNPSKLRRSIIQGCTHPFLNTLFYRIWGKLSCGNVHVVCHSQTEPRAAFFLGRPQGEPHFASVCAHVAELCDRGTIPNPVL